MRMCGILVALGLQGTAAENRRVLARQTRILRHRGPDSTTIWQSADGRTVYCFERLHIIDPSESGRCAADFSSLLSEMQLCDLGACWSASGCPEDSDNGCPTAGSHSTYSGLKALSPGPCASPKAWPALCTLLAAQM